MHRVLQIIPGGRVCGGIETFVMNYYRHIDRSEIQFDFLVHYSERGLYDDEIESLGGTIHYCSARETKNIVSYIGYLRALFRNHPEYRVIHGHMPGFAPIYLKVAEECGVPVRIMHSHVTATEPTIKGRVLEKMIHRAGACSNIHWACSREAGSFMFGDSDTVAVIPNAISLDRFSSNEISRKKIREELGIPPDCFVVGNVGRLCPQKNQSFLLRVFAETLRLNGNSILLLIGEGECEPSLRDLARRLGLQDRLILIGPQSNIEDYYQAMDAFALTSIFEGLGFVLVEAQACGLPCLASDVIPVESCLTDSLRFMPLEASPAKWAEALVQSTRGDSLLNAEMIRAKGYDIERSSERLMAAYEELFAACR